MDCARNIITANFSGSTSATTAPLWQWDYGQVLCITGIDLPAAFEVHFSTNRTGGVSTTAVGADGQVTIPNVLLTIGKNLNAWIYLSDSEGEGETEYSILIPVKARPMPETYDAEVSGEFDDVVRQVSEYAQTAQTAADNAGASASAAASSASEAAASASAAAGSATAAETAQGKAEDAQAAAETAAQTATQKAQQTAQDADQAAQSASDAESAAQSASESRANAELYSNNAVMHSGLAETYADRAFSSARAADDHAESARQSATAAAQSAASIEGDVQTATQKAAEAQTAAGQAVTAKDAAQTAQTAAEAAETNAGQSASTATTKAAEAAQSASSAAQSKTDAEAAATRAEQAAATLTVDSALSDTSVNPVQNKVIAGELTQLKSALSNLEEKSKIELYVDITGWVTKHYLNLNNPVGTLIIPGKINDSNNYNYIAVPVQPGDEFILTGTGGGDARLYGWLDPDNKLISKSSASLTVTDEVLIAEQVGYLAVNVNTNNPWLLRKKKVVIASATVYSLKDFGAVGDGVADDTDAIQLALNNVKDLYVPNGTYLFSKTLFIKSGTHLYGDGALSVFQLADTFTLTPYTWREDSELITNHKRYPMIMIESTESGCVLENFKLRGQTARFYDNNCEGLSVFGSNHAINNLIIEKINFFPSDFSGRINNGVGYGIRVAGTTVSVKNCTVNECGYEGIGIEDADTVLIENCNIGYSLQTGLQIHRNCQHIRVANNTINCFNGDNSYRPGITLHAIAPYILYDISITGNYIVSSLMFANGGAESDIRISDNFMVGINVNDFELSGLFRKNWVITGNTFTSGSIRAKCDNLVITNNMFYKNGTTPIIYAKTNKYLIDNNLPAGTANEVIIEPH